MKKILLLCLLLFNFSKAVCIVNPGQIVADLSLICYECMLPLRVGGVVAMAGAMPDNPANDVESPLCSCPAPPPIMLRIGVPVGFYNPDRLIDTVKDPYCFTGLGLKIAPPQPNGAGIQADDPNSGAHSFFQAHLVAFPVFQLLQALSDFVCVQAPGVSLGYITEIDPMWNDDSLSALINPEALLFGNPITNLACMADSSTSQANLPIDALFWCKGSWGNAYPMTGSVTSGDLVQSSASAAAELIYKLHRQLIMWGQWGYPGLCTKYPLPIWQKSAYRMQILAPIADPVANAIGQNGMMWDWAKNIPFKGDNFSYMIFRKRNCCAY